MNQNKMADIVAGLGESSQLTMGEMFQVLSRICKLASKPIVMNIAAKFSVDMNFSAEQIAAMLQEYEDEFPIALM